MRKEIRSEVDNGQTGSYRRHSRCGGSIRTIRENLEPLTIMYKLPDTQIRREAFAPGDGDGGDSLRATGEQIHPIADRRCVVRALTPSPSLLRGTRRRNVRLAEIGKIRAHQPHIGRHPIAEGRVRGQRENHVHHVVAEAAAVEGGEAE
jgi:hypothetical protein